jgi:hypothetical protein
MGKHDAGLKFYRAAAVPCPYLPNRLEEKILTFLPGGAGARGGVSTEPDAAEDTAP